MVESNEQFLITDDMSMAEKQAQLIKLSEYHVAHADDYPVVVDDPAKDYKANQTFTETGFMTITKYKTDITKEKFLGWYKDAMKLNEELSGGVFKSDLLTQTEDPKTETYYSYMKFPWPMSNRCMVMTVFYCGEQADGSYIMITTTQGNGQHYAELTERIGKDVIMEQTVSYIKGTFNAEGTHTDLEMVSCGDLKGSIPQFIKKLIAKEEAKGGYQIRDYLVEGKVPKSPW